MDIRRNANFTTETKAKINAKLVFIILQTSFIVPGTNIFTALAAKEGKLTEAVLN